VRNLRNAGESAILAVARALMVCSRMRSFRWLGLVLLVACAGEAPPLPGEDAPAEVPVEGQRVSGKAMDYFVAGTPLPGAALATDGIDPQLLATSDEAGAFAFEQVPVGSQVFFSASRASYRPTRNLVAIADAAVERDLYLMSAADVARQYATDGGKTPTPGRAFVIAELLRDNGTPLAGVPLIDVKLVDGAGAPIVAIGPYVVGTGGVVVPVGPTQTEIHDDKARVAFLDVPPGRFSLEVAFLDGQGQPQTLTTPVTTAPDGATLVRSGGVGGGGGTGIPANPRFAADVFPRLQTAANGGTGCANCHTVGGTGAVAVFNALASDVLASLKAKPGLIDLADPARSLLLTKPLYEPAPELQNHPNATFVDTNDPDYQLILLWIQQGAEL
jgi:hypothetical protein